MGAKSQIEQGREPHTGLAELQGDDARRIVHVSGREAIMPWRCWRRQLAIAVIACDHKGIVGSLSGRTYRPA
jgi:hypothetical protein